MSTATIIPLDRAYLCECRFIGDSAVQCPNCANRLGLMNLARVLDRKPVQRETRGAKFGKAPLA